jgi:O-acetyl-ADP-ribose deacetylase (regulator of RNase III)
MDDRVNRLIGYAVVRQVREERGTCRTAKIIRDYVEFCTGNGGVAVEDTRDFCLGWKPQTEANCTQVCRTSYVDIFIHFPRTRTYGTGALDSCETHILHLWVVTSYIHL